MKRLILLFAWALLVATLSTGCGAKAGAGGDEDKAGSGAVVSVRLGTVVMHRFEDAVVAPGQWRSSGDVLVASPFAATVESLEPHIGDVVSKGQRLGWLVTRESRAALRGAELLREQAQTPGEHGEADRALALARRDLVRVPLVSPRDGIVTHRAAEPGADVGEGAEVLTLTPRSALVCEAHVPAAAALRVHAGEPATLHEDGAGANRTARVQSVLPSVNVADQGRLVWLVPEGGGPPPALDRFITATIQLAEPHLALAVPDSAIVEDDLTGITRVAVVGQDSMAIWTTVTTGAHAGGWRELLHSSLPEGTRVIMVGQHGLPDSTHVRAMK